VIEGLWKSQAKLLYPQAREFNAFMGSYVFWTGIVSIVVMVIGGNILRAFSWFTSAVITPALTLLLGSAFFSFLLWHDSFANILASLGTDPIKMAVLIGFSILILAKSTKYALFDLTKEMAYIPLDDEMKVKGKVVVEVVGGRLGKASGAWLQSGMLFVFGFFSTKAVKLVDIAPCLFGILIVTCVAWMLAVRALSKRIMAVTAAASTEEPEK
jgi:AAA family ATP:ADP antiporter